MKLKLIQKIHLVDNVWRFVWEPGQPLAWQAGQFMRVSLPHPEPDAAGHTRFFTISEAPEQGTPAITTRLTGTSFKNALDALAIGDTLDMIEQPAGDFIWRQAQHPHIFAAQGIGITPFYAIIKDRRLRGLPVQATLITAHQPGNAVIFESELRQWATDDSTFKVVVVEGTLTAPQVAEIAPDYASCLLYVSGPKSFTSLCLPPYKLPISHLKQDNFPGYSASRY